MSADREVDRIRLRASLLFVFCLLALAPATLMAVIAWRWLPGLDGRSAVSAAAMLAGPWPFAFGAFFAGRAARRRHRPDLIATICFILLGMALYLVPLAWGARMLV